MDQYSHPEIEKILNLDDNKVCFECGNNYPKWASVNCSVILCLNCADKHRSFGNHISLVRSLTLDSWDENQIEYLRRGGNKRFREFLNEYKVTENAEMEFKYTIRASDYYRKLLKAEVNNGEPPSKPDYISGLKVVYYGINPHLNFDKITPVPNKIINQIDSNDNAEDIETNRKNKPGFFGKVTTLFSKAKNQVKNAAGNMGNKIKELEIKEKLKSTGAKTVCMAKASGSFVVEKGKEVYHHDIFNKVKEGFHVITDKTKKIFKKEQINESSNIDDSHEIVEGNDNQELRKNEDTKIINPSGNMNDNQI